MKFLGRIKSTLLSIRKSARRFPITVAVSTILAVLLIYMNESHLTGDRRQVLERIILVFGLGIPMSLCIGLLIEKFFHKNKMASILIYGIGICILVLYYFVFIESYTIVSMSRYFGTMLFLILSFLYIPRLGIKDYYEYYVIDIWSNFALTFIYSFVLYFGIAAIFFTINQLFDANIPGELFYYMFLIVALVFAVSLFLSKLPSINEEYSKVEYTKSLKVLLIYIVIPLITIYTAILYVYFGKILLTRDWPRGLVSHLVLWYSTLSVGVIFLITPILEENKIAKLFKDLFPKIIIPVLIMMFMSIYQRINQYGITENRYYLVALGVWVLGIMLYFSFKKPLRNIVIPISLSFVILNSMYGPLSSFAVSKNSQNNRLENLLLKNNMINDGLIVKNSDTSREDRREISNIISYFNEDHELHDITILPEDFSLDKMEELMGFKYEPEYSYEYNRDEYFYYSTHNAQDIIDIKGYDYYIKLNSWDENKIEIDGLSLQYNRANNSLSVLRDDKTILEQDLNNFIRDIHEKQKAISPNDGKNVLDHKNMTYEIDFAGVEENIILKFIFNEINGRIDINNNLLVDNVNFILLISNK